VSSADPDIDLVTRAKKELPNRIAAYEELMRRHEKLLYRVCYRIMGNSHDAEDAFQDVMVKVYHGIVKFEGRSSFKTWLFSIAHNTCYSLITRLAKSREFRNMMEREVQVDHAHAKLPEAALEGERLLMKLSVQDRELLTLKYLVELNFEEIAKIFDMGVSAVKMRVYRAVEQLKQENT
jgi:RNA polymerase sigma-70 factor (ECF subfamily)